MKWSLRDQPQGGDGIADALQSNGQLALDEFDRQAQDGEAEAPELGIPAAIGDAAPGVRAAIHFDHQLDFGGDEVTDAHASNGHLAAELGSEC